ncbi:MAG: hypothetical protein ACYDEU_03860 [Vulcanimicrobiaceae bacterium]
MGMFDKKSPEQMAAVNRAKEQALLDKHGLDLDAYDEQAIRAKNVDNIRAIASDLLGNNWFKAGMKFSFANAADQATVGYLSAIVQQNWIIIRQQERMIRLLSTAAEKTP